MFDVMVDIETLSTHPYNAVVLSVGAIKFKLYKDQPVFSGSKMWVLDIHEQIAAGRDITQNTLEFWRSQSDEARAHWAYSTNRVELAEFLPGFREFVLSQAKDIDELLIWANGICFDIGNLDSLYNNTPPWKYNMVRDHRTLIRACEQQRVRPVDLYTGPEHDPLADCRKQVWDLWEHWTDPLDPAPMEAVSGNVETGV